MALDISQVIGGDISERSQLHQRPQVGQPIKMELTGLVIEAQLSVEQPNEVFDEVGRFHGVFFDELDFESRAVVEISDGSRVSPEQTKHEQ